MQSLIPRIEKRYITYGMNSQADLQARDIEKGESEAGFEVVHVLRDSPAAEAEIQQGDVIVAIDGTAVYERGCTSFDDSDGARAAVLSIVRDGEEIDVRVSPRVLVP